MPDRRSPCQGRIRLVRLTSETAKSDPENKDVWCPIRTGWHGREEIIRQRQQQRLALCPSLAICRLSSREWQNFSTNISSCTKAIPLLPPHLQV